MRGARDAARYVCGMSQKYALPLFGDLAAHARGGARPSIEEARRRLGGPLPPHAEGAPRTGDIVDFETREGRGSGVVLHADDSSLRVMVDAVRVRHLRAGAATPHAGPTNDELERLSADARIFAGLTERQEVHFHDGAGMHRGTLVEKCVYGALIAKEDGRILAVGFRKLWPLPPAAQA